MSAFLRSILILAVGIFISIGGNAQGADGQNQLTVAVQETAGLSTLRPVTGGVPIAEGAAPGGVQFGLFDEAGKQVPLQTNILAKWKDGSARWVLLDFQAAPPANGRSRFQLRWGKELSIIRPPKPAGGSTVAMGGAKGAGISTADMALSASRAAAARNLRFYRAGQSDAEAHLSLTDSSGHRYQGVIESTTTSVDRAGVKSTALYKGAFHKTDGERLFGFQIRATVFAGLSKVLLEPQLLIDSDSGALQNIRELNLVVIPEDEVRSASIGGEPGWKGAPNARVRLFQIDDETYRFEGAPGEGSKAPGWAEFDDGKGRIAVAVKDFWQQWPKSIEVDSKTLTIGLLPRHDPGAFDHMKPWYKYQYLFENGYYRLRTGQAPRWKIWIDLEGDGAALAKHANAPLVPAADPAQAIATGVWGPIAPAGSRGMKDYDEWAENLFDEGYCRSIREQRDYGQMNWGDWWGERGCNWGNHEYDTAKQILLQYARTGDPKYFYVGNAAARHTSEVDVIHFMNKDLRNHLDKEIGGSSAYPARPGMVHQHCVGHVSGLYPVPKIRELYVSLGVGNSPRPYLCLDPRNLGHVWTQGMVYDYFLTGDPWLRETVETIGDNLVQLVEDRQFKFKGHSHCGRVNGWTMLAIAGAYELDLTNDRYLKAMRLLADDALSEQDPKTGGWLYKLPAGHCNCEVKHVGEAGFIGSVRLNGLSRYYELTGDERIPKAVQRGVTHLNEDTWLEDRADWRYTSCPKTGAVGQTGVTIMALVNSVKLNRDPEHLRVLRKAWDAKFNRLKVAPRSRPGLGKTYSTIMYGCPEAMNLFVNGLEN